ncbi:hypothetical protein AAG570_007719 [Ranatra chinensis]|uniref:Integrase catalytic domain-containing protein n=1 Tax=Ranatra chinensis TaxID=642074 RepID=A0ABD0XX06_9HEMI
MSKLEPCSETEPKVQAHIPSGAHKANKLIGLGVHPSSSQPPHHDILQVYPIDPPQMNAYPYDLSFQYDVMAEVVIDQLMTHQANIAVHAASQHANQTAVTTTQWLNTLMTQAVNIPKYEGEPNTLAEFLERCVTRKTGQAIREAILEFCAVVGLPKKSVVDAGAEFQNKKVEGLLRELRINCHIMTPGDTHSHGVIERLHSTLAECMKLLESGKGLKSPEAVVRATLAYNNSIHSDTIGTPLELMRLGNRLDRGITIDVNLDDIMERIEIEKSKEQRNSMKQINIRKWVC